MMKLPIQINLKDLSVKQNRIYLQYDNHAYPMKLPGLEDFNTNKENGRKLMHYLLTSKFSGASHLNFDHDLCTIQMGTYFNPVNIYHDPEPFKSFAVLPFNSLASLQFHTLKHVIADFWLNNKQTIFNMDDKKCREIWQDFQKIVQCKRYGKIDLLNLSEEKCQEEWSNQQYVFKDGCNGCINDNNDMFIRCCQFLEEYRYNYLGKAYQFIVDTIEDKPMLSGYLESNKHFFPNRLHVHSPNLKNGKGSDVILAFIIDQNNSQFFEYLLILKQKKPNIYKLMTMYPLNGTCKSRKCALDIIKEHKEYKKNKDGIHCHKINWRLK